jgi:hypothetical protein
MIHQIKDKTGAIVAILCGIALTAFPFADAMLQYIAHVFHLEYSYQSSESSMSFVGLSGRILMLATACAWYRTDGFDLSRTMFLSRNELLFYNILIKFFFYSFMCLLGIIVTVFAVELLIELIKIMVGFILLLSLLYAKPTKRKWF